MIKIIDNFLDDTLFNYITTQMLSENFSWFYCDGKSFIGDNHIQFQHNFYNHNTINSKYFDSIALPILQKLNYKYIVKVKANMTPRYQSIINHQLHNDVNIDCNTSILYLNDNDGKTIFENKEEVNSVKNRMIIFPSTLKHAGTTHTNTKHRMVINFNFL